jgi:1-acyl-sn-glycerol-3-phosphate acyltransferase
LPAETNRRAPVEQIAAAVLETDPRPARVAGGQAQGTPNELAQRVTAAAQFIRRRLSGDYAVDEFGFDPHFNDAVVMPLLRTISSWWFRVEVSGIENLPARGAALLVANHAGVLPFDALMTAVAVHDKHPAHRHLRILAPDTVFDTPMLSQAARLAGHTMACGTDAHRLLANGELTAVFPEGHRGLGKHFRDRYKLQRFGRGGFVSAAVATAAPIVPCSIVGSEEIYPMIADVKPLARLLRLPYFPVTPVSLLAGPVGLIPLPSKWHIEFGTPIPTVDYAESAADDPSVTSKLIDQVRETIQQTLHRRLAGRGNPFFGAAAPSRTKD